MTFAGCDIADSGRLVVLPVAWVGERRSVFCAREGCGRLAARDLDQETLDRRRRVLGQDHPDTLASADNLAADLRALAEADDNT